jgi:hypothetical protein
LRAVKLPAKHPLRVAAEQLTLGNPYTTTLHVVNSSIIKLGKLTPATKVYRGISGGVLPEQFRVPNAQRVRGGVEFAFMSTTLNRQVECPTATPHALSTPQSGHPHAHPLPPPRWPSTTPRSRARPDCFSRSTWA